MLGDAVPGLARPGAVLFDMDGTLVDTEKVWYAALTELIAQTGGRLSPSARTAIIGTAMTRAMQIVYEDLALTGRDAASDIAWLEDRVHDRIAAEGVTWQPGARELLIAVRERRIPTALVTSSARRLAEAALVTMGRDNFDVVITRDDVTRPKPDPEPYTRAAERLGVPASTCIAVEDSTAGVASARTAGATVIAISSAQPLAAQPGVLLRPSLRAVDFADLRSSS